MRFANALASIAIIGCLAVDVRADMVTLDATQGFLQAWTSNGSKPFGVENVSSPAILPATMIALDSVPGFPTAMSETSYSFDGASIFTTVNQVIMGTGSNYSFAQSSAGIYFMAGANLEYTLSGYYSATSMTSVALTVRLTDITDNAILFYNQQWSTKTSYETFDVAGLNGGDTSNQYIGAPSGTLIAGHTYAVGISATISREGFVGTSQFASGTIRLDFAALETPDPVPSPAAVLMGLPLLALSAVTRPRRNVS